MSKTKTATKSNDENEQTKNETPIETATPEVDEVAILNEKLLRNYAEFDNYKKRTVKEKLELAEYTKANCFNEVLAVVDNFERALQVECKDADFKKGIEMILLQLKEALKAQGLVEIEALNMEFNPELHNAISQIDHESLPSNTVCNVMQTGYKIGDKVVRHAMVVVVQ